MMKTLFCAIVFIMNALGAVAQTVKVKSDKVFIDGVETLTFKSRGAGSIVTYSNLANKKLFTYTHDNKGTVHYSGDDYTMFFFDDSEIKIESKQFPSFQVKRHVIEFLLEEEVLNVDGTLNEDKIEKLYRKYNQDLQF